MRCSSEVVASENAVWTGALVGVATVFDFFAEPLLVGAAPGFFRLSDVIIAGSNCRFPVLLMLGDHFRQYHHMTAEIVPGQLTEIRDKPGYRRVEAVDQLTDP